MLNNEGNIHIIRDQKSLLENHIEKNVRHW